MKCNPHSIKPTQFAIGFLEVRAKIDEMRKLGKAELRRMLKETSIPVVISPDGNYFAIDHHHFVFACCELEIAKVKLDVQADLSRRKMSHRAFSKYMLAHGWFHPYDQFGKGPHNPLYLPSDIRGLGDDPYRSLAWLVREEGGFRKVGRTLRRFQLGKFFS